MTVFLSTMALCWSLQCPPVLKRLDHAHPGRPAKARLSPKTLITLMWPLAAVVFFGFIGLLVALVTIPLARSGVSKLESAAQRKKAKRLAADLPVALNLLAAVVASGQSTESALAIVARHTHGPLGAELVDVARQLAQSSDPSKVWLGLSDSFFGKAARGFARSAESGSGVVAVIRQSAADVRREREEHKRVAASQVAVKTAAPLGLCFLPAFLLVGIVPMVLGISEGLFGF